ncbi:hypothetical protein ACLMJK_005024 [Lecanora helva]
MALPPERITVKRRRDEEPVEALYIQPKKFRPSGIWTRATDENDKPVFTEPVPSSPSTTGIHLSFSNSFKEASSPSVRNSGHQVQHSEVRHDPVTPRKKSEPRRFHLARSSFKVSSPLSASRSNARTRSNIREKELAVFIEAGKLLNVRRDRKEVDSTGVPPVQIIDAKEDHAESPLTSRKRPNATLEERRWRAETWRKPTESKVLSSQRIHLASTITQPSHEWNHESPELAAQLQQVAFEEIEGKKEHDQEGGNRRPLKIQPKPPKPRHSAAEENVNHEAEVDPMVDIMPPTDDTEYVYDTYIRCLTRSHDGVDLADDSMQGLENSNVGLLVIQDGEDEALWETFGEDVDSDSDQNSEEEDENAEDYYGNDYPEDEVDSDDELGRGAYNYRHYASDNEEFGDEEPDWSDDEKETLWTKK